MSGEPLRALIDDSFAVTNGELAIGGLGVRGLAEQFGTPLFVYDAGVCRGQLRALRAALPARIDIYYSVKANPNPAVVAQFVEAGTGLEIASGGEFLRGVAAGCPPGRMLFAGPGKTAAELELVVGRGIGEIHVESHEELDVLSRLDGEKRVGVRVNPLAAAAGGAMRMGGRSSPFGFDEERLEEVIARIVSCSALRFCGIHMFVGTQILDSELLIAQWRHAVAVARRAAAVNGAPLETVDLGGGLGIPYFPGEHPLALPRVRRLAAELFRDLDGDPLFEGTKFIIEPGRFLVGPAGVYLSRVLSVKHSRGDTFVVVDGGMHHHLAASGNLGQVIKRDFPVVNASRMDATPLVDATVVGSLCTPLDVLGRTVRLSAPRPGDLVAVLQSGAYGLTASPVGFLSHPMPAEVLIEEEVPRLIRRRGTFEQPLTSLP